MAKTKTQKFLVIVTPPRPTAPTTGTTWTALTAPSVRTVEAASAKEAAEKVGVPAGATAQVATLSDVSTFKRPATADLEAA